MVAFECVRHLDADQFQAASALVDATTVATAHPALSDDHALAMANAAGAPVGGGPGPPQYLAVLEHENTAVSGFGQAVRSGNHWSIVIVPDPNAGAGERIARVLVDQIHELGSFQVRLWVYQSRGLKSSTTRALGLIPERTLYQMRSSLPLNKVATIDTRPFRPGVDEEAWLEVNNRAFAWHPEQAGWDLGDMQAHERQGWFDPAGFLLHWVEGSLAGFCWTKVHADSVPPLGEIYVIATDPAFGRRGIGRQLVLAGLAHLAALGLGTAGLYVESDNVAAVKLYVDLGFVVDHLDRSYILTT